MALYRLKTVGRATLTKVRTARRKSRRRKRR